MTLPDWFNPIYLGAGIIILVVWFAATKDLRTMTIPNIYPMILIGLWIPFGVVAFQNGMPIADFGWQMVGGILAFFVGVIAFVARIMGGGDVKLMAALVPLLPFQALPLLFVLIALSGFVLALLFGAYSVMKSRSSGHTWTAAFGRVRQAHMPYGPAIATGVTIFYAIALVPA